MLDEFGNELENTDSKLDTTMKKVAKVLHMSNGELEKLVAVSSTDEIIKKR
jgi:syntaxin 6